MTNLDESGKQETADSSSNHVGSHSSRRILGFCLAGFLGFGIGGIPALIERDSEDVFTIRFLDFAIRRYEIISFCLALVALYILIRLLREQSQAFVTLYAGAMGVAMGLGIYGVSPEENTFLMTAAGSMLYLMLASTTLGNKLVRANEGVSNPP